MTINMKYYIGPVRRTGHTVLYILYYESAETFDRKSVRHNRQIFIFILSIKMLLHYNRQFGDYTKIT